MTDKEKLDAIRAEIHRLVDVRGYDRRMANDLFAFMESLPNEPVSNDLEEAAHFYVDTTIEWFDSEGNPCCYPAFVAGALWKKEKIIAKACEWLENYFKGVPSGTVYLEDFKKAIKE